MRTIPPPSLLRSIDDRAGIDDGRGLARLYIKQRVGVLVGMFKLAVVEGFLPPAIDTALGLVDGLRRGESAHAKPARRTLKMGRLPARLHRRTIVK